MKSDNSAASGPYSQEAVSSERSHRISIAIRSDAQEDTKVPWATLSTDNDDIALHIELRNRQSLTIAQRIGGVWTSSLNIPIQSSLLLNLEIEVNDLDVRLNIVGQNPQFVWPLPSGETKFDTSGEWTVVKRSRLSREYASQLIRTDVQAAGLQHQFCENLILDIGANNGDDTSFYLAKGFNVIAIEANPDLCIEMADRFEKQLRSSQLTLLNVGLSSKRDKMTFYVNTKQSEWSSFDREIASRGHPVAEIVVQTVTTSDIFAAYGVPYFVKIDIEGYDHIPVLAIAAHYPRPKFLSFENGELSLFEALVEAGYDGFQIVNQALVPKTQCPVPAQEGLTINKKFTLGSSGLFGRDLPNEWLPAADMRRCLNEHLKNVADKPDTITGEWYDLHARLSSN